MRIFNNKIEFNQSLSYKLKSKEIIDLIETIINKYISFWNMFLNSDWKKNQEFIKISKIGEEITYLNNNLKNGIKSLET